jgi:hypothetical protein
MTYFGVNYYLSGLHSYASGDPVPVPTFVYVAVILLTALALLAYSKYHRYKNILEEKPVNRKVPPVKPLKKAK